MKIIKENILLEERPQDINAFNDKFGDGSFDKFNKLKGRLKNNNISQDIVFHTKNTSPDEMNKILYDMENRVVKDETGKAKNNYKLVAENEHYQILDILDWETAMNLGDGTGWCISGRYHTDEVKPSQAKQYFNQYKDEGIEHFLYFMPKNNEEKYCLCLTQYSDRFEFWNAADNSMGIGKVPIDENLPEFTYNGFTLRVPKIVNGLVIENNVVTKVLDKSITNVVIPTSVTEIGYGAFNHCTSLQSITIPDSVEKIGNRAFANCKSLKSITIPDSVKYIDVCAFAHCTSLQSITIPDSVIGIGNDAFAHCTSLQSITLPNSLKEIGYGAFEGCKSLSSITIPNSVKEIGVAAFYGCYSLSSINIPDSVKFIRDYAFASCESFQSITIPNSVEYIGKNAFKYCTSLESITIPNSVKEIGDWAFSNCPNLIVYTNNKYVENYCKQLEIPYKPLRTNENINNKNFEVKEKMNTKINIREELNKIDNDTFNEYDLRNMYDSCEWTKEEKKKIVESLKDVSKLNRIISNKFFGIEEPVKTKKVLNESLNEKVDKYYVAGYFDYKKQGLDDNLSTNDVDEAKEFAWKLAQDGDFVIVKNQLTGKETRVEVEGVIDDVSEYLNDVFKYIDDESINEKVDNTGWANDYWHSIAVEDENKKKITDWIMSSDSLLQAAYDYYKNDDVEALNDIAVEYLDTNYKPIDYYRTFEGSNEFGIRDKKTNELILKSDNVMDINNWEDENNTWSDEDYDNALSIIKKAINEIGYYQWSDEEENESLKEGALTGYWCPDCHSKSLHQTLMVVANKAQEGAPIYKCDDCDKEFYKDINNGEFVELPDSAKVKRYDESLKESTAENIKDGSKDYTGKPFSDFLQDIDHRSRLQVEYKDYPGEVKGFGGMAHSVSWNFANCPIVSIEVPEDDRFNDFKVVIDASNALRGINESLKENYRSATSQDFSDIIDVIVSDITEDNIDIQEAIDENIEDWIVIESLVRPDEVIEALENNGINIHKKVEKIIRGKLPKDKNENLNEGYETIHCPDMSFQEIKDYCDAYECYVKNTGKVGEYIIYGVDSARVVDDLKADGLCESLNESTDRK